MNEKPEQSQYSIEKWTIYPDQNVISSDNEQITIEPKTMSVLVFLIKKQGQTISREEFIDEVWGGAIVTDNSLNQSISKLRKIFEDEAVKPRIIETVSKRGYRLITPIKKININDNSFSKTEALSVFLFNKTHTILLSILILIISFFLYLRMTPKKNENPSSIFSSVDGMERQPSFSKNTEQIVYVFGNVCNDESEIHIKNLGSEEIHRFAKFPGFKKFPRFSSDNKEVIFWNESDNSSKSTLYLVEHPDSIPKKLLEIQATIRGLDWSFDKKFITYSAKDQQSGSFCIFLLDKINNKVIQITRPLQTTTLDLFPVFSSDGKSITFIRNDTEFSSDVWQVNIETRTEVRMTFDNLVIAGLASTQGGFYYTRRTENGMYELLWIDEKTLDTKVILSTEEQLTALDAGNKKIVFQTNTSAFSISGYNLTSKRRSILFNSNYLEAFPEFSPTGDRFAFISNRTGPFVLWIGDITGTQIQKVPNFILSNVNGQPRWYPDESYILVSIVENKESNIYKINLKNGNAERYLKNASNPSFSVDGQFIYFNSRQSGASQIWKTPVNGGDKIQVTFGGGFIGFESLLDTSFYYMKETEDGIWQKKGTEERLIIKEANFSESGNWCLSKQSIYYSKRYAGIWRYDFKTKTSQQVLPIDESTCRLVRGLSVSPDVQSLLFSSDERIESDLRIIEY